MLFRSLPTATTHTADVACRKITIFTSLVSRPRPAFRHLQYTYAQGEPGNKAQDLLSYWKLGHKILTLQNEQTALYFCQWSSICLAISPKSQPTNMLTCMSTRPRSQAFPASLFLKLFREKHTKHGYLVSPLEWTQTMSGAGRWSYLPAEAPSIS